MKKILAGLLVLSSGSCFATNTAEVLCYSETASLTYNLQISYDQNREGYKREVSLKIYSKTKNKVLTALTAPISRAQTEYWRPDGDPAYNLYEVAMKKANRIVETGKPISKMNIFLFPFSDDELKKMTVEFKTKQPGEDYRSYKRNMMCKVFNDLLL